MSLQTDAETIRDLSNKIQQFEAAKALANNAGATVTIADVKITQVNGTVTIFDLSEMAIQVTGAQKTAAFAAESGWQTIIKSISAAWTP